jgi:hypothetical protein
VFRLWLGWERAAFVLPQALITVRRSPSFDIDAVGASSIRGLVLSGSGQA